MEGKVTYGTVKQTYCLDDKERSVYGIAAYKEGDINSVCDSALGISEDEEPVRELAEMCNALELSSIHLKDVAEDFIYSQKSHT